MDRTMTTRTVEVPLKVTFDPTDPDGAAALMAIMQDGAEAEALLFGEAVRLMVGLTQGEDAWISVEIDEEYIVKHLLGLDTDEV